MEREGFVEVGRYGAGNGRSRFGVRVGGKRCQLCYFVVFGPKLRERTWRGNNGTSSCGNKASVRTWGMGCLYRHRRGLHKGLIREYLIGTAPLSGGQQHS